MSDQPEKKKRKNRHRDDAEWMADILNMVHTALVRVHGEEHMKGCPPMMYDDAIRSAVHKAAFGKLDESRYPEGSLLHRAKKAEAECATLTRERDEARAELDAVRAELKRTRSILGGRYIDD